MGPWYFLSDSFRPLIFGRKASPSHIGRSFSPIRTSTLLFPPSSATLPVLSLELNLGILGESGIVKRTGVVKGRWPYIFNFSFVLSVHFVREGKEKGACVDTADWGGKGGGK